MNDVNEKKSIDEYLKYPFFVAVTVLSILLRYIFKEIISGDMSCYLIPWFNTIKEMGGLAALKEPVGNYNILYQTIIALFTYIDMNCVYQYKLLSCIFDFALALSAAMLVCEIRGERAGGILFYRVYAVVLILPTVFINSSMWGQCDSIYVTFIILSILMLFKEKYHLAFVMFGASLAFKLQAVFILPFMFYFYFSKKGLFNLKILIELGISAAVFFMSGIVGYIYGRNMLDIVKVYAGQTSAYPKMYINSSTFWLIIEGDYEVLGRPAIILTMLLLGAGMLLFVRKKEISYKEYLRAAIWTVWTVVFFLPSMHERYTYLLDILLLIMCFIDIRYIFLAAFEISLSLHTYLVYLFNIPELTGKTALLTLLVWLVFTWRVWGSKKITKKEPCP